MTTLDRVVSGGHSSLGHPRPQLYFLHRCLVAVGKLSVHGDMLVDGEVFPPGMPAGEELKLRIGRPGTLGPERDARLLLPIAPRLLAIPAKRFEHPFAGCLSQSGQVRSVPLGFLVLSSGSCSSPILRLGQRFVTLTSSVFTHH